MPSLLSIEVFCAGAAVNDLRAARNSNAVLAAVKRVALGVEIMDRTSMMNGPQARRAWYEAGSLLARWSSALLADLLGFSISPVFRVACYVVDVSRNARQE